MLAVDRLSALPLRLARSMQSRFVRETELGQDSQSSRCVRVCSTIDCVLCVSSAFVRAVVCCKPFPGEEKWWEVVVAEDNKLFIVMKAYKEHRKLVVAGIKTSKSFKLVELRQQFSKSSGSDMIGIGELMNKRWFCQWATVFFCLFN